MSFFFLLFLIWEMGYLHIAHMWFGPNLSCLLVVKKLALCPLEKMSTRSGEIFVGSGEIS